MEKEIFVLATFFVIYAFIGWVLESLYKSILQKKIVNSGFLAGPFCPIYGFGALIMYLSLKDVSNNIFVLFFFGTIALSMFEYIVGLFLELVFKTKYWDYSQKKFNIQGRVCLQNSLYWGILGIIFMRVIHPLVEDLIRKIPQNYLIILIAIGFVYFAIDTITTIVKLVKINVRLSSLEKIAEDIKEKIEGIKVKTENMHETVKRTRRINKYGILRKIVKAKQIPNTLESLHNRQKEISFKLEKKTRRLRKAFPTMKSEKLSNFLNSYKKP